MRSLVKNFYKLEELIVELKKTSDIIAITETWLDNTKLNKVSLQGYQLLNENSINADAGKMGQAGGVCLYIKNSLTYTDRKLELKIDCSNVGSLWIELDLAKNKQCILGVIYRHPKQNLNDFIQKISKCLDNLNKRNKTYYICGDVNVDFLSCDNNKEIKNYCDSLSSYGCMSFLNFPTRVTFTSSTLIDHLYSNDTRNDIKCKILIHDISDHFPFIFSVNTAPTSTTAKILKKRDMKFFFMKIFYWI